MVIILWSRNNHKLGGFESKISKVLSHELMEIILLVEHQETQQQSLATLK